MFPAYAQSQSKEIEKGTGTDWLQCVSFPGRSDNTEVQLYEENSDEELQKELEKEKNKRQLEHESQDSDSSSDQEREVKQRHKSSKKSKKKKDKKKKKKHKKRRSRSPSPEVVKGTLSGKWQFLEDVQHLLKRGEPAFQIDVKGDQSNRAFTQLPHTVAAVYKLKKSEKHDYAKKREKRYFAQKVVPPVKSVEVIPQLASVKPSTFIALNYTEESEEPSEVVWSSMVTENAKLFAKCRQRPNDISLWLKLLEFQKVYVPCSLTGHQYDSKMLNKMIWEKQLDVLTDAITRNPTGLELRYRKYDLLCRLEKFAQIDAEWEDVLRMSDYSIHDQRERNELWLEYARYARSKYHVVAKFNLEEAVRGYSRAIDAYRKTRKDDLFLTDLICDYTSFLVQCGHTEKATAIHQALIDFNLSQPSYLEGERSEDTLKTVFESYWDSSIPKFGENGHLPWEMMKDYVGDNAVKEEAYLRNEDEICQSDQPRHVKWATMEMLRQRYHWSPAKVDAEDVDRIILTDDIQNCLFRTFDKRCVIKMIENFFRFLSRFGEDSGYWPTWREDVSLLSKRLKLPFAKHCFNDVVDFLMNCYKTCQQYIPDHNWASILLDRLFDLRHMFPEKVVALSKNIIAEPSNQKDLELWRKMVRILAHVKGSSEAMSRAAKLFKILSSGYSGFTGDGVEFLAEYLDIHLGVHNYFDLNFEERSEPIPDVKPLFSLWGSLLSTDRAKFGQVDSKSIKYLEGYLSEKQSAATVSILTILNLVMRGPQHAFANLNNFSSKLSRMDYHSLAVKLHVLVFRHFYPSLSDLKNTVRLACLKNPKATDFAMLYVMICYKSSMSWLNVSQIFTSQDSLDHWLPIVMYQEFKNQEYQSFKESNDISYSRNPVGALRTQFDAFGDVRNPLFWRVYAFMELKYGNLDKCKAVLLRGLQCCPWSKSLYVDCALYYKDMLQQVVDTLTEKSLRIRTPIEELDLLLEAAGKASPVNNETSS